MTIPKNHLRACSEHRLVDDRDHTCPACVTGIEARPDAVADVHFTDLHMRQQPRDDQLHELAPLLEAEADRVEGGAAYIAVAEASGGDEGGGAFMGNAAGYTMQERWFNVAVIEYGHSQRETFMDTTSTGDAIETLKAGDPLVEVPEYEFDRLDPEQWIGPGSFHLYKQDARRVDDERLAVLIGAPNESRYKKARKELGLVADNWDLKIRTVSKKADWLGNTEALIEVSIPGRDDG